MVPELRRRSRHHSRVVGVVDVRRALVLALPAWVVSRLATGLAVLITEWIHDGRLPVAGHGAPGATGIWAWDAAWYRQLAESGYAGSTGPHGERFFPLLPLLGRGLGAILGGHDGLALLLVTNVSALAFGALVVLLVERELDHATAVRSVWLTLLAPGAVVLALAYAESVSVALAAGAILAVRTPGRAVAWAVPAGVLAGLARPTGILLAAVPLLEAIRPQRRGDRPLLAAAALAPVAGTAAYCGWTAAVYDDPLAPYHAQSASGLRGGAVANPLHGLFVGPNSGGVPAPWGAVIAVAAVALVLLVWRTLPASIAAWATLLAVAALTSNRAVSLPRYLSTDFP